MEIEEHDMSCGVRIAYELHKDPALSAVEIAREFYESDDTDYDDQDRSAAMVIFSDLSMETSPGSRLAKFLKSLRCGKLTGSAVRRNPNSKNFIRVWIFAPSHRKFRKWYETQGRKVANEYEAAAAAERQHRAASYRPYPSYY
jgi:hypothetical protein